MEKPCTICGEVRVLYYANKKYFCKNHRDQAYAEARAGMERWKADTEKKIANVDGQTIRSVV